ncbi:MAG: nucleotidyltransferase domain-containing protein [Candidatus Sifarchaeia archaeon]
MSKGKIIIQLLWGISMDRDAIMSEQATTLRDRDLILTEPGIFFRVYGYWHPPEGYVCDPEYVPMSIFKSDTLLDRRIRKKGYCKFYGPEGVEFVSEKYPDFTVHYPPLDTSLVGVRHPDISEVLRTDTGLKEMLASPPDDLLADLLVELIDHLVDNTSLRQSDLGIFGSLLAGIYHPQYSDLDITVYGKKKFEELRPLLLEWYAEPDGYLANEFVVEVEQFLEKPSPFTAITREEIIAHHRRKGIYGILPGVRDPFLKVEFEPIRRFEEIDSLVEDAIMTPGNRITVKARITEHDGGYYMPSEYGIETLEVLEGNPSASPTRVLNYIEQFRMMAFRDEEVLVSGVLEHVERKSTEYEQIAISYVPGWEANVLKTIDAVEY